MLANLIEKAMVQAITDTANESEAIWASLDLSADEKEEKVAALNHPDALRRRMLDYSNTIRAKWREEQRED